MSLVAQQYRDLFQSERRTARPARSTVNRVEQYRSLYEDSQATAAAAQAEVTSLQVQLDKAHIELAAKDKATKTLTEQTKRLKVAKDEKLQLFNQKLATIKSAVTKELDKQRSIDRDLQLTLDCILRCCRELCTHSITPEEFHLAVDLILSTLTSHPHIFTTSSSQGVEFGEVGRRHLASLPPPQRRQLLADIVSRLSATTQEEQQEAVGLPDVSQTTATPTTPAVGEGNDDVAVESSVSSVEPYLGSGDMGDEGEEGEEGEENRGEDLVVDSHTPRVMCDYESLDSASPATSELGRENEAKSKKLMVRSASHNSLVTRESREFVRGCVHVWQKRLGLREGSVFTGSLPNLEVMGEEGEESEDEGGEDEYIDPSELASAIISPKFSRQMSRRVIRRMDTMMLQTTPTYLKILPPGSHDAVRRGHRKGGEGREGDREGGEGDRWITDDDLSSVDWDAEDERELDPTSPAHHAPHEGTVRRQLSERWSVRLSQDERIYERIEDLALPTRDIRGPQSQVPRLPRRRSKVALNSCRRRFSRMKGMDGYEYLETPCEPAVIPMWRELSPALPPPRKTSALPPPRKSSAPLPTSQESPFHAAVQPHLSVPSDPLNGTHSPAISSDEDNQSDGEGMPERLYTTPHFITMETKPHPPGLTRRHKSLQSSSDVTYTTITDLKEEVGLGPVGGSHKALQPTKSHTLPASPARHSGKRVEYCGYLTKLDSRMRPGKRRWFVLAGSELRYYRNKEASLGRPKKIINLNAWCKLAVVDDLIFKLMTSQQTYHLSGRMAAESERWVQALGSILRRPSGQRQAVLSPTSPHSPSSSPSSPSSPLSGWAHMTDKGVTRKMWCRLEGDTLTVSPQPQDEQVQRVNMVGCSVRKVRDSLLMDNKNSSTILSSQLAIQEEGAESPLLLVPCNAEDKEVWFYQLNLASHSGGEERLELTPTEQHLATIYREGGAPDHPLWKHPVLNMTDSPLRGSLTSLPSASLTSKALRLFQNVQMFMATPLSPLALECHVTTAQHVINTCQRHAHLQDELYCQLLRQLTDTMDQNSRALQQGWCLLSLVIAMFLPHRPRITWYLMTVLQRYLASPQPIIAAFSQHCLDTVERVRETGPRKWRPSVQELEDHLNNFALNPTSLKISLLIPVELPDGKTEELEYDVCSTIGELLTQLNSKLGMPSVAESGFSLMSDWPGVEDCAFFLLPSASKLGDLLAFWWHALEELSPVGRGPGHRRIHLTYRNRLFLQSRRGQETGREAELLAYQISREIASGRHPVREEIKMAAIMTQLEYGDWERVGGGREEEGEETRVSIAREALLKFLPMKLTQMTLEHDLNLYQRGLVEQWILCAGKSRVQCAHDFLELARKWRFCGASLFMAEIGRGRSVWLAVHEDGVSLLSPLSMDPREDYSYDQLAAYGEDGDHLILVVTSSQSASSRSNTETEKLLLVMSKAKIQQATDLMTSYLESRTVMTDDHM